MTVKSDIESEFGRNGWGLIGKIIAIMAVPMALQIGAGIWWAASTDAVLKSHDRALVENRRGVDELAEQVQQMALNQARREENIATIARDLREIKQSLVAIFEKLNEKADKPR